MLVLFQEGIPNIFIPELTRRGMRVVRFPTAPAMAEAVFQQNSGAEAIFFRANFSFGAGVLALLPKLTLAALVSTGTDNVDQAAIKRSGRTPRPPKVPMRRRYSTMRAVRARGGARAAASAAARWAGYGYASVDTGSAFGRFRTGKTQRWCCRRWPHRQPPAALLCECRAHSYDPP
ncbi:MAG: hypothetical protein U1F27_13860 [Turneriella sp.]